MNSIKKPLGTANREPTFFGTARPQQQAQPSTRPTVPTCNIESEESDNDSYYDDYIYDGSQPSDTSADFYEEDEQEGAGELQIDNLPMRRYKTPKNSKAQCESCSICLADFLDEDVLRTMPCTHNFHSECITVWLRTKNTCPLCKTQI